MNEAAPRQPPRIVPPTRHDRGTIFEAVEYGAFRAITWFVAALPHRLSVSIGGGLGALWGRLQALFRLRADHVARMNLRLAFPEWTEAQRIATLRRMWRSWGAFSADTAMLTRLTPERIRDLVRLDPPERFRAIQERAKVRGALILTAHYGSFELLHAASAAHGQPITLVHRTMANRKVDAFLVNLRASVGTRALARGYAAREVLQALRAGQVVAIPFDQAPRKINRVFAPFFGIDAATNSGLARLALAAGAPVYPVVLAREGDSLRHRMVLGPEIALPRTGQRDRDVEIATARFNEALESLVRERPEHWIWMYRRWKARPDGLASPYEPSAPPAEEYRRRTRERLEREALASSPRVP